MGEVFAGRYELVDPLGRGGMGEVWRTFDHERHGYVAAKVLRQGDAASTLRFVREQSFRIDHPHVVLPLSWAGADERVLFTMRLVPGGSVASLVGDFGPLPAGWVAVLTDQLLSGLEAVHALGLVHRDLKPANLLLEATGRGRPHLRLSDFGAAAPVDEPRLTRTSEVFGTRGYVAPERLAGADPEPRQDLWTVGIVMAEMLTGSRPGVGPEQRGPSGLGAAPPGADPALWEAARALAAPDPTARPDTATRARAMVGATGRLLPEPGVPADDGRDLEVFDQLPALPPGWSPAGPDLPPAAPTDPAVPEPDAARRRTAYRLLAVAAVLAVLALVAGAVAVIR